MRRDARHLASAFMLRLVLFCLFFPVLSIFIKAGPREVRVVEVKVAAAADFKTSDMWRVEIFKMVRDVNLSFKSRFGIAFRIREVDFWQPERGPKSLLDHLRDLIEKVPRGNCHLIIGIIPACGSEGPPFGAADYLHACVLIKDHPSKSGLTSVLEHELCHIFGAVDLDERESIMSLDKRGGGYDPFTTRIIILNRERSFAVGHFPLPPDAVQDVIGLYKERLGQKGKETASQKKEKTELQIVLSHLLQDKSSQAVLNH